MAQFSIPMCGIKSWPSFFVSIPTVHLIKTLKTTSSLIQLFILSSIFLFSFFLVSSIPIFFFSFSFLLSPFQYPFSIRPFSLFLFSFLFLFSSFSTPILRLSLSLSRFLFLSHFPYFSHICWLPFHTCTTMATPFGIYTTQPHNVVATNAP